MVHPLVFETNGAMGEECIRCTSELDRQLSEKQHESYATVMSWLRPRLSIEILKSALLCVRGSRTPFRRTSENIGDKQQNATFIEDVNIEDS